jgi:RND family efflux transporter MFP subunit
VNVSTKVSGQIVALHFEQGDEVVAGQVLARIEDVLYRARRDEAAARLERSKANRAFQEINHRRVHSLRADDSAPPIEEADAQRLLDESKAQVAADEAALTFTQKALDDTVVTAPIGGVILTRNVEVGDFVAAEGGIGANANARFATIADMTKLRVEVDVSELDIARLDEGLPCTIVPDAYKDREYPGHIMWIDPGANYSKATVQVKVRIENPDDSLRVEGTAQVRFLDRAADSATAAGSTGLWVPTVACVIEGRGPAATVFVAVDGRLRETAVELGVKRGDMIEVRSGLDPGQQVAIPDGARLREGLRISP